MDAGDRIEDGVLVEREPVRARKLARERIQQDFGVRLGIHVAEIVAKHLLAERPGIDQIAVVRKRDAVWGIDVEGLRFIRRRAPGGRIADVPDAHAPPERLHVVRLEDVAHESVGLALVDLASAGEDARRILSAVLQRGQRVVQVLVDVGTDRRFRRYRTWQSHPYGVMDGDVAGPRLPRVARRTCRPHRIIPSEAWRENRAGSVRRVVSLWSGVKPLSRPGEGREPANPSAPSQLEMALIHANQDSASTSSCRSGSKSNSRRTSSGR